MKCTVIIDPAKEQEIVIYAHRRTKQIEEIEALAAGDTLDLIGYNGKEAVRLRPTDVYCFTVEAGKVYALTDRDRYWLKCRLYQLEAELPNHFVKINQSCIADIGKIDRFDSSISGALLVRFKNGYSDYVSRRRLKAVKERIGL